MSPSSAKWPSSRTPGPTSGAMTRGERTRHRHPSHTETFVVLEGTLTMYLREPAQRDEVRRGGLVHVDAMTPLQTVNNGMEDLLL